MNASLVAIVLTSLAGLATLLLVPKEGKRFTLSVVVVWIITAAVAFLLSEPLVIFFVLFLVLAIAGALSSRGAVYLYIGVISALPLGLVYDVPFPGLNYLITLDYAKLATLVLLGPTFLKVLFSRAPAHFRGIENLLLFFLLFTSLMSFRDLPFTSVLRTLFDQIILIYIPFIAISRTIKTQKDVEWAMRAILAAFAMLAAIGMISALRSWNYYSEIDATSFGKAYFDFRNGLLRVGVTVIPALLAFLTGAGAILAFMQRGRKKISPLLAYAGIGVFLFTCFATGARGGWVAALALMAAYVVFYFGSTMQRKFLYVAAAVFGVIGINLIFGESDVLQDEYGTVSYRAELIRTSLAQIQDRPLFGSSDIFNLPRFQHLRQGEGIIDLVNGYLQIVLFYGLVGLGAFLGVHYLAITAGLKELKALPDHRSLSGDVALTVKRSTLAFLLALQGGYLVLIATISFVSEVPHYGYIILALVVSQARVLKTQRLQAPEPPAETNSMDAPIDTLDSLGAPEASQMKTPDGPVPYGARFVRRH